MFQKKFQNTRLQVAVLFIMFLMFQMFHSLKEALPTRPPPFSRFHLPSQIQKLRVFLRYQRNIGTFLALQALSVEHYGTSGTFLTLQTLNHIFVAIYHHTIP